MIEQWYDLLLEPGPRPALVLDASESAHNLAPFLRSLAEGVVELMPESSRPRIFFLGNAVPYDSAEFAARGEAWFAENCRRGSFITQVLEALESEPEVVVAVAGGGRIFDLPDWKGHPLVENAIWMKVGPAGLTSGAYREENYACEQLAELLNNPLSHVEICGRGAMPIGWDDSAFHLDGDRLVGHRTAGILRFGVLTPEPEAVAAAVVMKNGTRRELRLRLAEPLKPPDYVKLPHAEFMLLRQCLNKGRYQCPACSREHPAGQLRCPVNRDVALFPTLEAMPGGGFVLIDTASWETRTRPHPLPVLRLSSESVAVRDPQGGAKVLRYDPAVGVWAVTSRFAQSQLMQDKLYAMVH